MTSHDHARAEPGGADEVAATRDALRRGNGLRGTVPTSDGEGRTDAAGPVRGAEGFTRGPR